MEISEQSDQLVQHASQVLSSMERLSQDRVLTDLTVHTGNTQFHCHKILLRICGIDLGKLSRNKTSINKKQGSQNISLELDDIPSTVVEDIINFCYTGKLVLCKDNVKPMLEAASMMNHEFLTTECARYMEMRQEMEEVHGHVLANDRGVICQPMHGVHVLTEFQSLRSHSQFTDVTLVCEGDEFSCHSLILAACSDYFKAMFSHDFTERKVKKINLVEPGNIIEDLLTFMYSSKFDIENEGIIDILTGAAYFQVLFPPATINSIKTIANTDNCFRLLEISNVFSDVLRDYTLKFIFKQFAKLIDDEGFLNLPLPVVTQILSDDRLNILAEELVFLAATNWLKYDPDTRSSYLDEVMDCVRFPLLHDKFLLGIIDDGSYIMKSATCKEMIEKAIQTKQLLSSKHDAFNEKCHPRNSMNQDLIFVLARAPNSSIEPQCAFLGLTDHRVHTVNTKAGSLPSGLSRFTVVCKDTDIFVIGGWDTNHSMCCQSMWKYSIVENTWSQCANLNVARYDIAVGVMDDFIFAIGGQIGSLDVAHPVTTVEKYDTGTDQWIEVDPLPSVLTKPVVTVYKDRLFAMDAASHSKVIRTLCVYHSFTGLWGVMPAGVGLMNMRYIESLLTMGNSILCWGLYDGEGLQLTYHAFQTFNAENFPPRRGGLLVRHPPLVSPRLQHPAKFEPVNPVGLAMQDDTVFVISDAQARRGRHLLIDRYDPYTNTWDDQIEISTPLSKGVTSGLQCVAYKGYIAKPWQYEP
ncbi:ectoderm-neural cortex protein 1-like [Glandiceps talaboti]